MKCEFENEEKKCNHHLEEKAIKFCSKHQNTLQSRENDPYIIKIGGIHFLIHNKKIVSYIEGLKVFPLRFAHLSILKDNGFEMFIDKKIKERLEN